MTTCHWSSGKFLGTRKNALFDFPPSIVVVNLVTTLVHFMSLVFSRPLMLCVFIDPDSHILILTPFKVTGCPEKHPKWVNCTIFESKEVNFFKKSFLDANKQN